QRLCDMDGTRLVHDSTVLIDGSKSPTRSVGKLFVQLGLPLVVLSVLAFYSFRHQVTASHTGAPTATESTNATAPANAGASSVNGSSAEGAGTHTNEKVTDMTGARVSDPGKADNSNTTVGDSADPSIPTNKPAKDPAYPPRQSPRSKSQTPKDRDSK